MASSLRIIVCVFVVALGGSRPSAANDVKVKVGFLGGGESVTLMCDLPFSKPKAQVTWSDLVTNDNEDEPNLIYDGKNVVSGHVFSSHFSVSADLRSLTITNPSADMTGEYICLSRINNTYTARRSYRLDLVERAKCKTEGGTDLMEGQRTTVYCTSSFSGYLVPVLRWTRNGQPVNSTHKAPTAVEQALDMTSEAYQGIDIEATGDDDKAVYACHMDVPDQAPIECKITLNVKHSLRNVDIVPASGDIHANDVVTCTGRANPPAQITLKVNVEGVAAVKAMNSASLKIQPAWVGRFILVDCTATADNGAHMHSLDTTTSYTVLAPRPDPQTATAGADLTMLVIVFIVIALVIVVIVIVAVVCVMKKKQSMNKKVSKEKATREEEKKLYHDEAKA